MFLSAVKMMLFLLCLFLSTGSYAQLEVGDQCGAGNRGKCVTVDACDSAVKQLQKYKRHNLERCGWLGISSKDVKEIVCCMDEIIKNPVRKSVAACMRYKQAVQDLQPIPFIVGGQNASLTEYPHMTALGFEKNDVTDEVSWGECGGSLISEDFVITAAHCMVRIDNKLPIMVRLGIVDLFGKEGNVTPQDIPVADNILHPNYDHFKKINDIALIKLARPVKFTEYAYPICLYIEPDTPKGLSITGWGRTKKDGQISRFLLKAPVKPVTNSDCNRIYLDSPVKKEILDSMLCADSAGSLPTDTCQGDSGGPIQVANLKEEDKGIKHSIVGITSFGIGCGGKTPSVYTRVNSYLDWIESTVW